MPTFDQLFAIGELIVAAAFWGFGFIAVIWSLETLNFAEVTWLRFALAALVGLPFILHAPRSVRRGIFRLSFWPSVFLAGTLIFQSWGLKYTTATKSGFITTLYVVFVPLLESLLTGRRLPPLLWACVVMAFAGTALIVEVRFDEINIGDILTLVCAFFATFQIYSLGAVSPRVSQPFLFNASQSVWGAALIFPLVVNSNYWQDVSKVREWPLTVWLGVGSLAFGSTLLAFYLQIRAQAKLSATVSSLLFLLESPFAMLFSIALLGEKPGLGHGLGAFLIFVSAALASWADIPSPASRD
jgi:drug/metabolite transporter (DMT)-like permease